MEQLAVNEKLVSIFKMMPQEVIEMYNIDVDTFMSEKYKLYIKSPVWMTLDSEQIEWIRVSHTYVEIRCKTIGIMLKREYKDMQIVVL